MALSLTHRLTLWSLLVSTSFVIFAIALGYRRRGHLRVDQAGKQARNELRTRIRRALPAGPAASAESAHPTTHPEFVPMVFSSTNLD